MLNIVLRLFCVGTALTLFGALPAAADSIIDTTPWTLEMSQGGGSGADTAGGTFTATDSQLDAFTLYVGSVGGDPNNSLSAIVMDTVGGVPDAVLWESGSFNAPGALAEFVFSPELALTAGEQYFIGIDSGNVTGVSGGDFTIGATSGDPLAGGSLYMDQNGGGWTPLSFVDVSTTIQLSSAHAPEPGTGLLVLLGLCGFVAHRRLA